jgi:protein required for attachment to host cells
MKKLKNWILLMDGLKAKVLTKNDLGTYKHIYGTEHLEEFSHQKKVFTHHLGRIKQHGADWGDHHVFPLPEKPKKIDKELFARKLANFLNQNVDLCDKILLVAPDHMLGYLRTFLRKEVKKKIYKEVHKDLMRVPLNELDTYLNE